jgi:N utilization substance protein B
MISRRNIRVKVMQLIYALESREGLPEKTDPVILLRKEIDRTGDLFTYLLYFLTEVARYAETDATIRASKNLPSYEDLHVNTKIAGNELLWKILESPSFKFATNKTIAFEETNEEVRKIYHHLAASEEYKNYISIQGRDKASEKEMMLFIFSTLMLPNEDFVAHVEEHFANWDDDAEMINQLMLGYLSKPQAHNMQEMITKDKWDFAKSLLQTTIERRELLSDYIKPRLKNWDADRIAMLDMILMQMGICELLYFETIPPKVTINEYIDIAKEYSTPQSGQFVNGIIDGVHKELVEQNKIHKIDFRQKA